MTDRPQPERASRASRRLTYRPRRLPAAHDLILERARHLRGPDRPLVEAVYGDGRPIADLARLSGVNAGTLRRRLRRAVQRILSDHFLFATRHQSRWGLNRRRIARECLIEGRSMRQAARALGLSIHTVRRHCLAINAQFEAVATTGAPAPCNTEEAP